MAMIKLFQDKGTLEKYSTDRSPYKIRPKYVAFPRSESDVISLLNYAKSNGVPVTARGAGSNLSGSSVGSGIIIDFSRMNKVLKIKGNLCNVQPGIVYGDLNKVLKKSNLFLPYSPSSGDFCTVGGNVGTKASGFRGVKYGSVDNFVKSVKFVDCKGRVIDTSKKLPKDLEKRIMSVRNRLLKDKKTMKLLKSKSGLKTSSGYNMRALCDYKDPRDMTTHLMVGSVGTLGIVTEIRLRLAKLPRKRMTCLAYFVSLEDAGSFVLKTKKINPSAIEIMDSFALDVIRKYSGTRIPKNIKAALFIEIDDSLDRSKKMLTPILEKYASTYTIETDAKKQGKIWTLRSSLLTVLEKREKKVISFVEDIGVPPAHLAEFIGDLQRIFKKNNVEAVVFGHAGEGNLHLRPVLEHIDWEKKVRKIANECYSTAFSYNGTVTGEHGSGRNKSPYMTKEWGSEVIGYFHEIKNAFDPGDILNPGVMFSRHAITKSMKY